MSSAQPPKDPGSKDVDAAKAETKKLKWQTIAVIVTSIIAVLTSVGTGVMAVSGYSKLEKKLEELDGKRDKINTDIGILTGKIEMQQEQIKKNDGDLRTIADDLKKYKNLAKDTNVAEVATFLDTMAKYPDSKSLMGHVSELNRQVSPYKYNISGYWHSVGKDGDFTERVFIIHNGTQIIKIHLNDNGMIPDMRGVTSAVIDSGKHVYGYMRTAQQVSDTEFAEYHAKEDPAKGQASRMVYDPEKKTLVDSRATYMRVDVKLTDKSK